MIGVFGACGHRRRRASQHTEKVASATTPDYPFCLKIPLLLATSRYVSQSLAKTGRFRKLLVDNDLQVFQRDRIERLLTALSEVRVLVGELDVSPAELWS